MKKVTDQQKNEDNDLYKLFNQLNEIFDYYIDDKPENIIIYSLWTIGTIFHDQFITYPYLFLNAVKGSGKSRLLRLIATLGNGTLTTGLTESVLFRTKGLLCLDECESLHTKEKLNQREIFNTAYKKGGSVVRMIKIKNKNKESFEPENFPTYRPIAMANIYGMENILGDRCLTCTLEKSFNENKTKIIEDFENDSKIIECKKTISTIKNKYNFAEENLFQEWNDFIKHNKKSKNYDIFVKIKNTEINGRNLELFFPLLMIALKINENVFNISLEIFNKKTKDKIIKDYYDNIDIRVYNFISEQIGGYYFLFDLLQNFKRDCDFNSELWITTRWFSNELNKLDLIMDKRLYQGRTQIKINIEKAKEKLLLFRK